MFKNLFSFNTGKESNVTEKKTVRIGPALSGKKLIFDETFITYTATDERFKVKRAAVDTVTIDSVKTGILKGGQGVLQVIGKGTVLASIKLPLQWAEQMQEAILNEI